MTDAVLALHDLSYRWPGKNGFSVAVPSFDIAVGETVLLLGESGSGKSTLLSLICGTIVPDSGSVTVAGTNLGSLRNGARDRFRAETIGVIFQQFNLLPFGTVEDNILLPLHFAPRRRASVKDANAEVTHLCSALGLPAGVETAKAAALSVGQQQRVAVARALIGSPPLIVADEPTSALDADSQRAFLDLMFEQVAISRASLMMVSHDERLADRFDRVLRMHDIAQITRGAA